MRLSEYASTRKTRGSYKMPRSVQQSISSKGFNQRDAYRVMLRKYPDVMNIEQMCDALKVSTKTGYKLLHEGKIPAMKIGRSYRIPKAHLFTYLQICGQHCQAKNRQC